MRGKKKNAASNHLFAVTGLAFLVLLFSVICFLEDLTFLSTSAFTRTYLSIFIYFHRDISFYLQYSISTYTGVPVHLYICFHRELPFYVNLLSQRPVIGHWTCLSTNICFHKDLTFYLQCIYFYRVPAFPAASALAGTSLSIYICFKRGLPFP